MEHRRINDALIWKAVLISSFVFAILWIVSPELWESPFLLVQDDARHFVVWLRQISEPGLFPSDPIAANFKALTPVLYSTLFWPAAQMGIDMLSWYYLAVTPLACVLLVLSSYRFLSHLLATTPVNVGFATFLLCTLLASLVIDGLPRSFSVSIIFFSLTSFLEKKRWLLIIVMFAGASLYPAAVVVAGFTMVCFTLLSNRTSVTDVFSDLNSVIIAGVGGILGLAIFLYGAADTGPTMLLSEARGLSIFSEDGRTSFFRDSFINQILCKGRGGVLPICIKGQGIWPALGSLALSVGGLAIGFFSFHYLSQSGIAKQRLVTMQLLVAMLLAGLILFILSYLVAFRAHLPSRYSQYSIGLVFEFSKIFAFMALVKMISRYHPAWGRTFLRNPGRVLIFITASLVVTSVAITKGGQEKDGEPAISQFLRQTPIETTVAGLVKYVDKVPAFSNRSVYVAMELLVPYKRYYYYEMAQRVSILEKLYGLPLGPEFAELVVNSGIDYFIISRSLSKRSYRKWTGSFPSLHRIIINNTFTKNPQTVSNCTVVNGTKYYLVDAHCMREAALYSD